MELLTKEVVYSKNSQELTSFLYEGIIENLEEAIDLIGRKSFLESNHKLQKANDILHRLGVGLKYEAGPIAQQLDELYNFMSSELIVANIKKDPDKIKCVLGLVTQIAEAWHTVLKKKPVAFKSSLNSKVSAYESNIMRSGN